MMTTDTILRVSREEVQSWSANTGEPSWLTEQRIAALELTGTLDWPRLEKMNLERWNLESFGEHRPVQRAEHAEDLPKAVQEYIQSLNQESLLVQRNSRVVYSRLSEELTKKGVIFTELQTALQQHADLVKPYLFSLFDKAENKVTALHAALWSGGVFLYVPKNVVIEQPLQVVFLTDEDDAAFSPHILIVAEPNSRVTYVDNVICTGRVKPLVHNGMAEVIVKSGARVQFASVHSLKKETTDLTLRRARVEQDGRIEWMLGELNDGDSMSDTLSILEGNGSVSETKLICVCTEDQKVNVSTRVRHDGRSTVSDMLTRAVMRDEATGIFNGITKIEKGATGANGQQTERVLMLSPKARGDANPMLLIDEDDVQAGHAASVGQVNKEQIYYLMSRGISRQEAINLIVYGFLNPILSEIPIESVGKQLAKTVERKLGRS